MFVLYWQSGTHQHHQILPTLAPQLLQTRQGVLPYRHSHLLAHPNLSRAGAATPLLRLGPLDVLQTPLPLRQRRLELLVFIVSLETLGAQLVLVGGEYGLAEVLAAQLADEGQARRREEHLLADLGGVRHVGDRDELRDGVVALEEDVEGVGVGECGEEERGDIVGEGGGRGGAEELHGDQGFVLYGGEEAEVGVGGEEVVEFGGQLLRGCGRLTLAFDGS